MMFDILFLFYFVLSGAIFASFNYEKGSTKMDNIVVCLLCFPNGWFMLPILIGRVIRKIYDEININ